MELKTSTLAGTLLQVISRNLVLTYYQDEWPASDFRLAASSGEIILR